MAKPASKSASPRKRAAKTPADPRAALLSAAKSLIAERGWRGLSVAQIAGEAGLSVAEAYRIAPTRDAVIDALTDDVDAAVVEALQEEELEPSWRDRLFDALMIRFDVLLPDRDIWRVIAFDSRRDPTALGPGLSRGARSMERLLEAVQLGGDGPLLRVRAAALAELNRRTFRVWLKDKEDQAKTMADLDRRLRRIERLFDRLRPLTERLREAEDDPPAADPADPSDGTVH